MRISHVAIALALLTLAGPARAQGILDLFGSKTPKVDEELLSGAATETEKIVVVPLSGVISSAADGGALSRSATTDRVRWHLDRVLRDVHVRGVILEINSPGGEITASDVMNHLVREVRLAKKPVVALLGDVAASGGYYVAAAADRIIAHPTTITGSIGVIMHGANMSGLLEKLGLKMVTLKSTTTPMKDLLSPVREMTAEEKKLIEALLDEMYERFVSVISESRRMPVAAVKKLADGRIYTATQAKKAGLVDEIGYREDAVRAVMKLAKVGSAKVVRFKKAPSLFEALSSSGEGRFLGMPDAGAMMDLVMPRFMYLWSIGP